MLIIIVWSMGLFSPFLCVGQVIIIMVRLMGESFSKNTYDLKWGINWGIATYKDVGTALAVIEFCPDER